VVRFQLRAEDMRRGTRGMAGRPCWHVARVGALFTLCGRALEPATSVRPIQDATGILEAHRCAECWERAFNQLPLPA
jgi:hypothetical protein